MGATQASEFVIVKSLNAKAGAVEAETTKSLERLRSYASRINLDRHFRVGRNREALVHGVEQRFQLAWRKQRRSAATKIDRIDFQFGGGNKRANFFSQTQHITLG